jgi:hypothetical protein
MESLTGYQHPDYVQSLSEFGTPRHLPASGGWILERAISGGPAAPLRVEEAKDAMGPYPLFTCRHWEDLPSDVAGLPRSLVTLVLVTDPFAEIDPAQLGTGFDFVKPFKCHYVADLTSPFQEALNKHHRYYARKSLRDIETEVCEEPLRYVREWIGLYGHLVQKHGIRGLPAFSVQSFHTQLRIPGMVLMLGRHRDQIVGAHLVAIQGDVAYSHLAAFSSVGYQNRAAYGVYWATLEYLTARHVRYLDLGGAAGLDPEAPVDGLTQFKRGWSRTTRLVYLCGRVFDPERYAELCRFRSVGAKEQKTEDPGPKIEGSAVLCPPSFGSTDYFPAYRAGEFDSDRNGPQGEQVSEGGRD